MLLFLLNQYTFYNLSIKFVKKKEKKADTQNQSPIKDLQFVFLKLIHKLHYDVGVIQLLFFIDGYIIE